MAARLLPIGLGILGILCCRPSSSPDAVAFPDIDGDAVIGHVRVLASDAFEGRAPGTKGEDLTVRYIVDRFREIGLSAGNTDGTFFQSVPLVGITSVPETGLRFEKGSGKLDLRPKDDFVAYSRRAVPVTRLDGSEVVFVGYGVQAPEFGWDDYKGLDVTGKTIIVLVGDPPVPDSADPGRLDPGVFAGKAMTYYGRWTYKYEIGTRLGAAGVFIVHETAPAGYDFSMLHSWVLEHFDIAAPDGNAAGLEAAGWLTLDSAKRLFGLAGMDLEALKEAAAGRDFEPVPLGAKASITLRNALRTIRSRNVVARLEGGDPDFKDEHVIYTAHWDHFGTDPRLVGDTIYNGAQDNATGVGGLIELARAFKSSRVPPKRSILFLAVTGEEQGLLGSEYYARNPIYPLAKAAVVINLDVLNVLGRTRDLTINGLGMTDVDAYAIEAAARQGRVLNPNPWPERGGFYRSDHFPLAKRGVPALDCYRGIDYAGKPADFGMEERARYAEFNHKPSDEIRSDWVTDGMVEDLQFFWMVGFKIAQAGRQPEWKPGGEFKAAREVRLESQR